MESFDTEENESLLGAQSSGQSRISLMLKGILSSCACALFTALSAICVQGLRRSIPDFELNAVRNGFAWALTVLACFMTKTFPLVNRKDLLKAGLYAVLLFVDTASLYISVTFIPLATQQALYNTTNLLVSLILLWIMLKKSPTWDKIVSVIICIVGVVLVLQPDFIFISKKETVLEFENESYDQGNTSALGWNQTLNETNRTHNRSIILNDVLGYGLSVLTGLALAGQIVTLKYFSDFFHTVNNQLITLFWIYLFGTLASVILMLAFEQPVLPRNTVEYLLSSGHCVFNVFILPTYMCAGSVIDGNTVNILYSTVIVYMVIAQYTVLIEIFSGNRNWIEIFGICAVIFGSILSSAVQLLKLSK